MMQFWSLLEGVSSFSKGPKCVATAAADAQRPFGIGHISWMLSWMRRRGTARERFGLVADCGSTRLLPLPEPTIRGRWRKPAKMAAFVIPGPHSPNAAQPVDR
jgi:hypothetical protein